MTKTFHLSALTAALIGTALIAATSADARCVHYGPGTTGSGCAPTNPPPAPVAPAAPPKQTMQVGTVTVGPGMVRTPWGVAPAGSVYAQPNPPRSGGMQVGTVKVGPGMVRTPWGVAAAGTAYAQPNPPRSGGLQVGAVKVAPGMVRTRFGLAQAGSAYAQGRPASIAPARPANVRSFPTSSVRMPTTILRRR